MLFEDRLGMELYRPIGPEWHTEGFWDIYNHPATREQYLGLQPGYQPEDGTPPLNDAYAHDQYSVPDGVRLCWDAETPFQPTKACRLEWFKSVQFDYVIASVPQHIAKFQDLINRYQPNAKLIVQVGNDWEMNLLNSNILCSGIDMYPNNHTVTYNQEFDLNSFYSTPVEQTGVVSSFINNLQMTGNGWDTFVGMERDTQGTLNWRSFGGQCRDGCITGSRQLGGAMRAAEMIYNVKPNGDGYGHVLHNAYAVGRPVIVNRAHYAGKHADRLLVPGTCLDLNVLSMRSAVAEIKRLHENFDELREMGRLAAERFTQVVNFDEDEAKIRSWLENLR